MRTDLQSVDRENFLLKEGQFCGVDAVLINPQFMGCKWTQMNSIFRSSVWSKDGDLLSAGFRKFVNLFEKPEHFPPPNSFKNSTFVEKMDGSLCIIDSVKDRISMRTRGTFSYKTLNNAADFELCLEKYPKISNWLNDNSPWSSLLFELTSPNLPIVLKYTEPDLTLVGCIDKADYSMMSQDRLNKLASHLGVKRPEIYKLETNSVQELSELIKKWEGREGICWYHTNDSQILKCKSDWYLLRHRMKENLSLESIVDYFIANGMLDYLSFKNKLAEIYDFETLPEVLSYASKACDAWKSVIMIESGMKGFVESLKSLPRRDAAAKIISSYGQTNRASFVFQMLDGKTLNSDNYKKLLWQCLKS